MQIIKKYGAPIFLLILMSIMLVFQLTTQFIYTDNPQTILEKRSEDLTTLFATPVSSTNINNEYFEHALPSGMQVFAMDKNNFKLRYDHLFFEVHVFTSKISSQEYAKAKYDTMQKYTLQVPNANIFFYLKEMEKDIWQLAMYSDGIEVIVNTSKQALENTILKSAEIIHGTKPLELTNNSIYIGGNTDQQPKNKVNNEAFSDEGSENNNELPVTKA